MFDDVLNRREAGARAVEVDRLVALGAGAGRTRVIVAPGPPHADEPVHREADLGGFLDRGRVHGAPTPHHHPVRPFLAHLQPVRRLVLHFLDADRNLQQFEAHVLRELLEKRDRLAAITDIEIDEADLLAFHATVGVDISDDSGSLAPVGSRGVENPGKLLAVSSRRQAVAHGQNRNLVDRRLRDQLQGDARGIRVVDHRTLALGAFVALNTLLGVVAGFAFLDDKLHATDAPVTLVEHGQVVMQTIGNRDTRSGERSGTVGQKRNVDRVFGLYGLRH